MREIISCTEQYWCPIDHSSRHTPISHKRIEHFVDYGDAEGYRKKLEELREALK